MSPDAFGVLRQHFLPAVVGRGQRELLGFIDWEDITTNMGKGAKGLPLHLDDPPLIQKKRAVKEICKFREVSTGKDYNSFAFYASV